MRYKNHNSVAKRQWKLASHTVAGINAFQPRPERTPEDTNLSIVPPGQGGTILPHQPPRSWLERLKKCYSHLERGFFVFWRGFGEGAGLRNPVTEPKRSQNQKRPLSHSVFLNGYNIFENALISPRRSATNKSIPALLKFLKHNAIQTIRACAPGDIPPKFRLWTVDSPVGPIRTPPSHYIRTRNTLSFNPKRARKTGSSKKSPKCIHEIKPNLNSEGGPVAQRI